MLATVDPMAVTPAPVARTSRASAATPGVEATFGIASFPAPLAGNPYQRLLYRQLERHGFRLVPEGVFTLGWLWRSRRDVRFLHFHWPQGHYRVRRGRLGRGPVGWLKLPLFAVRLLGARLLRYRLVWTIHQVYPHERGALLLERAGARLLASSCHVLLAHDRDTAELARAELGRAARPVHLVPHGSYIDVYGPGRPRDVVRTELGIPADAFCLLCLGELRAYKSVDLLLRAFAAAALPHAVLIVAGRPHDEVQADLVRRAAAADARIRPLLRFVPDDLVGDLLELSDAVVLPRSGGTSGSLILALSFGKPAVAAHTGAYADLLAGGAAGWLFEPDDERSLAEALRAAAGDPAAARAKGAVALRQAERLDWDAIGARTAELLLQGGNA